MTSPSRPPVPIPDERSIGFWNATQDGRLTVQRCAHCGWLTYPPVMVCTKCLADPPGFEWSDVSGQGRLATWTIVRDAFLPGFAGMTPYVVGEVELVEQAGLRIAARIVGIDHDALRSGLPVRVEFTDGGEGTRVPVFVGSQP